MNIKQILALFQFAIKVKSVKYYNYNLPLSQLKLNLFQILI